MTGYNPIHSEKSYQLWRKWMAIGERTGCHQRPDRSFFLKGYQLPICARCTGVVVGYLLAIPCFLLMGFNLIISVFGCFVMLADWSVQACNIKKSSNVRRLITGILGGYGIMSLQLQLIKTFYTLIKGFTKKR
jgi:uncharacterized membrane protein